MTRESARGGLVVGEGLSVTLGAQRVLRDVSFSVGEAGCTGLIGPNGSGKTTLLRVIAGLQPYEGSAAVDGKEIADWKPRDLARRLAFLRQNAQLQFDFTVDEFVALGLSPHKRLMDSYSSNDLLAVRNALDQVDIGEFGMRSVLSLSGGEQQRVFLAQAIIQESDILLLDEPTAHLDVYYQYELMDNVRSLAASGRTIISVFHDLSLAVRYADNILVLDEGQVVAEGPPSVVLTKEMLEDVFRMEAEVSTELDGSLRIHYIGPARQERMARTDLYEDIHENRR